MDLKVKMLMLPIRHCFFFFTVKFYHTLPFEFQDLNITHIMLQTCSNKVYFHCYRALNIFKYFNVWKKTTQFENKIRAR